MQLYLALEKKMLRTLVLVFALVAAAVVAWFTLQPPQPSNDRSNAQPATKQLPVAEPIRPAIIDHKGKPISPAAEAKAITHIEKITPPEQMPLNIRKAQHFVTADQLLQLPLKHIQTSATLESAQSAHTSPETENQSKTTPATPVITHTEQAISGVGLSNKTTTPVSAPAAMNLITITSGTSTATPDTTIVMTPNTVTVNAVSDAGLTVTPLRPEATETAMSTQQQRVIAQSQATLLPSDGRQIKLKELLDHPENSANKIFYLHAVHQNDDQGMWGIIQAALVNSFAEGIALPGNTATAQASIPSDADERLHDRRSSFLGHILQRKVQESYIYNYDKGMLGRNPDLIQPGQQLVIITFTEEELVQIYQFFATP